MNGEIPSVPITTLAGVTSLTDLLPELPLPTPLLHNSNNKSLLYHHGLSEEAKQLLNTSDAQVVSQLVNALSKTNIENIELHDDLGTESIEGDPPELAKAILACQPNAFCGRGNSSHSSNLPNHNEHPSPHQAGPSPCTPGSPARVPQQIGTTIPPGPSSGFQNQFLNFASHNHINHVTSPAQASAAPTTHAHENGGDIKGRDNPVVVLEPIQINEMLHPSPFTNDSSQKKKNKSQEEERGYNVIKPAENAGKLTLKIAKSKHSEKQDKQDRKGFAGTKRRRSDDDSSRDTSTNDDLVITGADFAPTLGERVKRRRTKALTYREDEDEDEPQLIEIEGEVVMGNARHSSKNSRQARRDADLDFVPAGLDTHLSNKMHNDTTSLSSKAEHKKHHDKPKCDGGGNTKMLKGPVVMLRDCMDYSPTQRKFLTLCDTVLESAEDADMVDLAADEDEIGGSSAIVRHTTLVELCSEAAKLKSSGIMNLIPYGRLVKVLTILQYNIKDGCRPLPAINEDGGHDEELLREIALEKVLSAVDASLVALYVMTSKSMPKEVYLEDVIDRLVTMTKIQLQHTVYPEFDPVYRVDPKNKTGYSGNYKAKRARSGGAKNRIILQLYNKLAEVISLLSELVEIQTLTDTIVLQTSTLTVSPFFVENVKELQLNSLKLVTNIFSRYEKHRQLIMEDILASLARLPSSKKNLRSYRLKNSEDHIQMVTALALELIQCVVKLPASIEQNSENEAPKPADNMDSEVIIVTSFENAMRTAHNFLAVYLKKCTTKGEEDYRPLFENFVYDLLATVNKPEWPAAELLLSLLGRLLVQQFSNKSVDMSLRVASLDYLGIVAARLRKDAVTSLLNEKIIEDIIKQIKGEKSDENGENPNKKSEEQTEEGEQTNKDEEEEEKEEDENEDMVEDEDEEKAKKSKSKKKKVPTAALR